MNYKTIIRMLCVAWLLALPAFAEPFLLSSTQAGSEKKSPEEIQKLQREQINQMRLKVLESRARAANARDPLAVAAASSDEAIALIQLSMRGDQSDSARRRELVGSLRDNALIPRKKRFEMVAGSANVDVASNRTLGRSQRLAAFADVARQLMRDFPEQFEGFASLLRIAHDWDDKNAQAIAEELSRHPNAPDDVKSKSTALLKRIQLIGSVFPDVAKATGPLKGGTRWVCLYIEPENPERAAFVEERICSILPSAAVLHGMTLNLLHDPDGEASSAIAATANARSADSKILEALFLDEEGLVYVFDNNMKLLSVLGEQYLRRLATR